MKNRKILLRTIISALLLPITIAAIYQLAHGTLFKPNTVDIITLCIIYIFGVPIGIFLIYMYYKNK